MITFVIRLIALATYKRGIQKHAVIISIIHIFNPITNSLLLISLGAFNIKLGAENFLILTLVFHSIITFILYLNYQRIESGINKPEMRSVTPKQREYYALGYVFLVSLSMFIAIVLAGYSKRIIAFIHAMIN